MLINKYSLTIFYVDAVSGRDQADAAGTLIDPFKTPTYAYSRVSGNDSSNRFEIRLQPGIYTDSPAIKPFVSLVGDDQYTAILNMASEITYDAEWDGVSGATAQLSNLTFTGAFATFDSSGFGAGDSSVMMDNLKVSSGATLRFFGRASGDDSFNSNNTIFGAVAIQNAGATTAIFIKNSLITGNYEQISDVSASHVVIINSFIVNSSSQLDGRFGHTCQLDLVSTPTDSTLATAGVDSVLNMTVDSYISAPSIAPGSTFNLANPSNALNANFSPSNYTPVDGSVHGHLEGIDNKLAGSFPVTGTYTPTLNNTTNVTASTAFTTNYVDFGSSVMVWGRVDVQPATVSVSPTQLDMSLPAISNNFTNSYEAGGTAASYVTLDNPIGMIAVPSSQNVRFSWIATGTTNRAVTFAFSYKKP